MRTDETNRKGWMIFQWNGYVIAHVETRHTDADRRTLILKVKQDSPKEKPILLTVSILVSNRIDTIETCLESIQPLLKAIPSELIVVDTVGEANSDGSLAIAKRYADRVVHFDWCDDFSAARNAGLTLARGKWFLYLDDDEWFDDVTELIEFFRAGEYKRYNSASHAVHNYSDAEQTRYTVSRAAGMTALRPEVRFVDSIHEHYSPALEPMRHFSAFVHHVGYIEGEGVEKKAERNCRLLEQELEKNPRSVRLLMHLAGEYLVKAKPENIEALMRRALAIAAEDPTDARYTVFLRVATAKVYLQAGQLQQAAHICLEFLQEDVPALCRVWLCHVLALVRFRQGEWRDALQYADQYFALCDQLDANACLVEAYTAQWLEGYAQKETRNATEATAIRAACRLEWYSAALMYCARHSWAPESEPLWPDLVDTVCVCEARGELLERAVRASGLGKDETELPLEWIALLQRAKKTWPKHMRAFTRLLADWTWATPYLLLQRALVLQWDGNAPELAAMLDNLQRLGATCRPPYEDLLPLLASAEADARPFTNPMDREDWDQCANRLAKLPWEEQLPLLQYVQNTITEHGAWHGTLFCLQLYGRHVAMPTLSDDAFEATLCSYVKNLLQYGRFVFSPALFLEDRVYALPREVRFALCIEKAYAAHAAGDTKAYLVILKEAAHASPKHKGLVSRLLSVLEKQMEPQPTASDAEFAQLAAQIKQQARGLLGAAHPDQAEPILRMLLQLLPGDTEARELLAFCAPGQRAAPNS